MSQLKINKRFGFLILVCLIALSALVLPVSALTHITDASELQNINLNLAEDYVLDNNIDLTGVTWTPIGTSVTPFVGSLSGNNYTISDLYMSSAATDNYGMFSYVGSGASFSDINLDNCYVKGRNYVGILVGHVLMSSGTHDWCIIDDIDIINSQLQGGSYVGNIVGYGQTYAYTNITNCDITDSKMIASIGGGIIGEFTSSSYLNIKDCTVTRTAFSTGTVAGIAGYAAVGASYANITGCIVQDSVISGSSFCGGITGYGAFTATCDIYDCHVINTAISTSSNIAGGICGVAHQTSYVNIYNSTVEDSTVTVGSWSAGGILAYSTTSTVVIDNCQTLNSTVLSNTDTAGGISGVVVVAQTTVTNCNVANTNVKGSTTYTFGETYDAGSCTSSDITNVAGLKILAQDLSVDIPVDSNILTFTAKKQGAGIRIDGSGFIDTSLVYTWDFDDGSPTSNAFTDVLTHTYAASGSFNVTVTITNNLDTTGSTTYVLFDLASVSASIESPTIDSILITTVDYTFVATTNNVTTYLWDFGDGNTSSVAMPSHIYTTAGSYNVTLTVSNLYDSFMTYREYTVINYADITNVTATLLQTEQITLNTYATQRYNPVQQYALSASVLDIKYVSSSDAYMVSGNTPYYINSKTSVITPVSNYVGTNAVLCAIDESGIVIYDTEKVISYYSYATGTRQIIGVVDGITSITLGKADSPEVNIITYTTAVDTYYHRIDTGVTYSSTTPSIYNGIVGNPYNKMFLSWNNVNPSNVTISYLNAGVVEDSTHYLALTAGTTIQSIQSIDNTNNFIVRTTNKIFVVEVIDGSFNLISTSESEVPAFSEVRADKQLEYMGLNETSAYFVSDTGALATYYTGIAQLNTLAISSESGIWSAFGGYDNRLTILGRSSPTTWNLSDQIFFSASINKVVLSTGGYYLTVVSDGSLYLLSQATPYSSDTILTTKYYLQVYLMENGQYLDNTRFTVGIGETAPRTYTTDASGSYVVEVVPSRTYTIAFSDGSKSTTYTANNFALQYLILSKPSGIPVSSGLTNEVVENDRLVHMSYSDSYGRNNLVNFTIWNATTILQTYSSVTNDVSYTYDATEIKDSYLAVVLHVSNPNTGYTYDKSYTVWLKEYADPTNKTGLILPGAKKPLIPAAFWSDTGIPIKLDSKFIQLLICGGLMVVAGLFGAQHSAKGALLVAGLAALFTVLGLLVIDPIWVAMMVVIGILALFSYARDYD